MKKQNLLYGLFLGVGIGLGALVASLAFHPPRPSRWENKMNLSQEEKKKIRGLFQSEGKQMGPMRKKVNEKTESLKKVLKDPKATDNDIRDKFKDFNNARNDLTLQRFEMNLKIRKLVGPEKMDLFDILSPAPNGPPRGKGGRPREGRNHPPREFEKNPSDEHP